MAVVEEKSYCRVCGSACGIVVTREGETVVKVRADTDHPVSRGYTCPKGRAVGFDHHRADRIEQPMLRRNGQLVAAGWDEVLDDLAPRLQRIIAETGPVGVGSFIGGGGFLDASGFYSLIAFLKTIGTPSAYSDMTIDSVSKSLSGELFAGISGLEPRADLARTRMVVFLGTNPVISHTRTIQMHAPTAAMRDMQGRGAELWTIDPRRSETAARSDGFIQPRPGLDYAVLGHAIRELLIDGADRDYLAAHAQGADALAAAVSRFTRDYTSKVAGVPAEVLDRFVAAIRRNGRLSVETGTGVTMQRAGNVTGWLALALMAVTGSLDREGGAWVNPGRIMRKDRMDLPAAPEDGWNRPGPSSRPELRGTSGDFPCAAIPDEIAAGNLRALAVFGGNLEVCLPERARSFAALQDLEVLAVFDINRTRTVDIASHVLPTKGQLERSDMTFVTDTSFPLLVTQYTPAILAPVGARRGFWWILGELGARMGIDFFPGFDHAGGSDDAFLAYILGQFDHDFAELKRERLLTEEPVIGWVQRFVDAKIGGWRLAPRLMTEQLAGLEARESASEPKGFILIPRRQKYHENSKLLDLRDPPQVMMHPADAQKLGFAEGRMLRVSTASGKVERQLKIDDTLRPGVINVPHGWSDALNVNNLTSTTREVDPITGMLLFSGLEVAVEAA